MNFKNIVFISKFLSFNILVLSPLNVLGNVQNNDLCTTPECYEISKTIINNMDTSIDPCEDFYEFTCGNFIKNSKIPENKDEVGTLTTLYDRNRDIVQKIVEGNYVPSNNSTASDEKLFNILKRAYNLCMDSESYNKLGKEPLIQLLDSLGIRKNKDNLRNPDVMAEILAESHNIGSSAFFDLKIMDSLKTENAKAIYLMTTFVHSHTLSKEYYENQGFLYLYRETISNVLKNIYDEQRKKKFGGIFEAKFEERSIEGMAQSIVKIESRLAAFSPPTAEVINVNYLSNLKNLDYFNKNCPFINWKLYFDKRFGAYNINYPIDNNTEIFDTAIEYFEALSIIFNEFDNDAIVDYLEWVIIYRYINYVADDVQEPIREAMRNLTGIKNVPPKSETCIDDLNKLKGMANIFGKFYVDKTFSEETKKAALEMTLNIKESMINRLPQITWLDKSTMNEAINKAKTMEYNIGYQEIIGNPDELYKQYENLNINTNYFDFMLNYNKISIGNELRYKSDVFDMAPQSVNAQNLWNTMSISAGILQKPLFNANVPSYLNYGGSGMIIGHELTHSFDSNAKDMDSKKLYRHWWDESTSKNYDELTKCFINQYSEFYIEDDEKVKHYNKGEMTLCENIADSGGIARAYEAWKSTFTKNPEQAKMNNKALPNLTQFTPEQLYFISYATAWCAKSTAEYEIAILESNPHSPNKHRVNGVAINSKYFADAFHCKKNSPMNPEKKCSIW